MAELLVGMSLSLIVLGGVYTVYETCQETYWRVVSRSNVNHDARAGLEQMRRELRLVGSDPSGTGQAAVQTLTGSVVEFVADVDGNNVSDLVKYDRDALSRTIRRTLKSWTGTAWGSPVVTTLSGNVDSLSFEYFPSASVPGVKRIRVSVQLSETRPLIGSAQHTLLTDIQLRNL